MNEFKMTKSFHESFENTLNTIEQKQEKKPMKFIYKIAAVAASFAVIGVAAVFTADATGIISLNNMFTSIFSIKDNKTEQLALNMSSSPKTEVVSGGVTARIIQAINDDTNALVLLELSSKDKILNKEMYVDNTKITVSNTTVSSYTAFRVPDEEITRKRTVDDLKKELLQHKLGASNSESTSHEQEQEMYKQGYTDKLYLYIPIGTYGNMEGETINLSLENLCGLVDENNKMDDDIKIKGKWEFQWQLSSDSVTKTYHLNREYGGIHYKDVTLTPISYEITYTKNPEYSYEGIEDEELSQKISLFGVRYKNGETQGILTGNSGISTDNQHGSLGYNIIDVEEVQSIFIGEDFTEIKLPEPT